MPPLDLGLADEKLNRSVLRSNVKLPKASVESVAEEPQKIPGGSLPSNSPTVMKPAVLGVKLHASDMGVSHEGNTKVAVDSVSDIHKTLKSGADLDATSVDNVFARHDAAFAFHNGALSKVSAADIKNYKHIEAQLAEMRGVHKGQVTVDEVRTHISVMKAMIANSAGVSKKDVSVSDVVGHMKADKITGQIEELPKVEAEVASAVMWAHEKISPNGKSGPRSVSDQKLLETISAPEAGFKNDHVKNVFAKLVESFPPSENSSRTYILSSDDRDVQMKKFFDQQKVILSDQLDKAFKS